jgi:hypothetical protein
VAHRPGSIPVLDDDLRGPQAALLVHGEHPAHLIHPEPSASGSGVLVFVSRSLARAKHSWHETPHCWCGSIALYLALQESNETGTFGETMPW